MPLIGAALLLGGSLTLRPSANAAGLVRIFPLLQALLSDTTAVLTTQPSRRRPRVPFTLVISLPARTPLSNVSSILAIMATQLIQRAFRETLTVPSPPPARTPLSRPGSTLTVMIAQLIQGASGETLVDLGLLLPSSGSALTGWFGAGVFGKLARSGVPVGRGLTVAWPDEDRRVGPLVRAPPGRPSTDSAAAPSTGSATITRAAIGGGFVVRSAGVGRVEPAGSGPVSQIATLSARPRHEHLTTQPEPDTRFIAQRNIVPTARRNARFLARPNTGVTFRRNVRPFAQPNVSLIARRDARPSTQPDLSLIVQAPVGFAG
ncbi:hypothetical protein [Nonomuraea sp. NPDC005692]|uniref:hypothetical protein n=1 Tax=Nonomuraea sp. NPDC005692 TaxID=3157168 RepID=UPI0034108BB7